MDPKTYTCAFCRKTGTATINGPPPRWYDLSRIADEHGLYEEVLIACKLACVQSVVARRLLQGE